MRPVVGTVAWALSEVGFGAVALIDRALACVPMRWTG